MSNHRIVELVELIKSKSNGKYISTAESCTGGLVASYLTSLPGSSKYFAAGIVSYSNIAKMKLLHVDQNTLDVFGAVSEETAREMALGSMKISDSDIAVSITGIAGPGGFTAKKPVGMVCFALATKHETKSYTHYFTGNREEVRNQACFVSLELIMNSLG